MKTTDLLASLGSHVAQRTPIAVTVVTRADMERVADMARGIQPDPIDRNPPNAHWPWEAPALLDAPGIDCSTLDRGRTA